MERDEQNNPIFLQVDTGNRENDELRHLILQRKCKITLNCICMFTVRF